MRIKLWDKKVRGRDKKKMKIFLYRIFLNKKKIDSDKTIKKLWTSIRKI